MNRSWKMIRGTAPAIVLAAAFTIVGCNSGGNGTDSLATDNGMIAMAKTDTKAASLRQALDSLLQEHVALIEQATNASLAGRNDEFTAAANAIDANSQELAAAIGSIYGSDGQNQFYDLWKKHIGFYIEYTSGLAKGDKAASDKANDELTAYSDDLASFLEATTGGRLKKDPTADLIRANISGVKGMIDSEAQKDWGTVFPKERQTEKTTWTFGDAFAAAIVDQFPDKFQ